MNRKVFRHLSDKWEISASLRGFSPALRLQEQRKEIDPDIAAKYLIFLRYLSGHYKLLRRDCIINGQRYQLSLGNAISRSVALEIATAKRSAILKGEAGIAKKRKDILFDKAAEEFLSWARANKRPRR